MRVWDLRSRDEGSRIQDLGLGFEIREHASSPRLSVDSGYVGLTKASCGRTLGRG